MNKYKQCVTLSKVFGWLVVLDDEWGPLRGRKDDTSMVYEVPDYLNDLNVMHEAEKSLSIIQRLRYYQELIDIFDRHPDGSHRYGACIYWESVHATASQRAEAFLKTLGLWKED